MENAPRTASTVCKGYFSVAATEDLSWVRMESNAKVRCMVVKEASGPLFMHSLLVYYCGDTYV